MLATEVGSWLDEALVECSSREWADLDELASELMQSHRLPSDYRANAVLWKLKRDLRWRLRSKKDADGFPIWHSIKLDDDGTGRRIIRYKQLQFFERDDYVRVWKYWERIEYNAILRQRQLERRFAKTFEGENLKQQLALFEPDELEPAVLKPSQFSPPNKPR